MLADYRSVADARTRIRGGVEGEILRIAANNGEMVDAHASTEFNPRLNNCMGRDAAAGSERRARFDDRKRTDLDVGGESGGSFIVSARVGSRHHARIASRAPRRDDDSPTHSVPV